MVTVLVSDSGSPVLGVYAQVNVTVCRCNSFGECKSEAGAVLGSSVGISFIALLVIVASVVLLLCKSQRGCPDRLDCMCWISIDSIFTFQFILIHCRLSRCEDQWCEQLKNVRNDYEVNEGNAFFPLCPPALVLLLLAVVVTTCGRRHHMKKGTGLLGGESEDDIRDNVFNYDEQGGGEEDEVRGSRRDTVVK